QTADPDSNRRVSAHRPDQPPDADDQDASHAPPRQQAGTAGMPEEKGRYARDALLPAFETEHGLLRCRVIFHFQLDIMTAVRLFKIQRHAATVVSPVGPLA